MAPRLTFFMANGACSLAPHILLHEVGIDFRPIVISVNRKQSYPKEYLHINPKGRIPILQMDDEVITEAPAIMTAIAQLAPEKHLLGKTPLDIVRTYEWFNWISGTLHGQAFGQILRPERFSDDIAAYKGIEEKGNKNMLECFDFIEGKLESEHAVGDAFTAVDAYLLVFYRWANAPGDIDMEGRFPKYTALVRGLLKREAAQKAIRIEGIKPLGKL